MKKIRVLLLVLICSCLSLNLKAQYHLVPPPDSNEYDLLYVFDTTYFTNCFMTSDTNRTWQAENDFTIPYSKMYKKYGWYLPYYKAWCDSDVPILDGYVIGANKYNNKNANYVAAFAQEYHLDESTIPYDDYVVVGAAMKIGFESLDTLRSIYILDDNFDTLATTIFHTYNLGPTIEEIVPWNRDGWNTYYFYQVEFESLTNITDFKIAFDVPKYNPNHFHMHHTCSIFSPCLFDSIWAHGGPIECGLNYDTIYNGMMPWDRLYNIYKDSLTGEWITKLTLPHGGYQDNFAVIYYLDWIQQLNPSDNIPLCAFADNKYIKHEGEWINFEDDPVYTIWQNIYIAMVPIIMIPRSSRSLSEVELEKMCYLFPNPTKDYFKVMSHYTIKSIQVYDIVGKLLLERNVNNFDAEFDASGFSSGSYIVKINTVKGEVKKKLIIE